MDSNELTKLKLALEHSRGLFIYHAGQRIQSLNFYFVAITVFLTGFGFLATSKLEPGNRALIGLVLAIAGFCLSHFIQALDKRNEQLVHCDEFLLKCVEERLATTSEPPIPEWKVIACSEKPKQGVRHYAEIVPKIFRLYKGLSIFAGVYFTWPWIRAALAC